MYLFIRKIHSFVWWITAFSGLTFIYLFGPIVCLVYRDERKVYTEWVRVLFRTLLFCAGVKYEVQGFGKIKQEKPTVLVLNHPSIFDDLILLTVLPRNFRLVGDAKVFRIPIIGKLARKIEVLPVGSGSADAASKRMEKILTFLDQGQSIAIYPEGDFTPDGKLGKFRLGAAWLAIRAGVSVTPMVFKGAFELMLIRWGEWSEEDTKARAASTRVGLKAMWLFRPGFVRVVVGDPIPASELKEMSIKGATNKIREVILSMLGQ